MRIRALALLTALAPFLVAQAAEAQTAYRSSRQRSYQAAEPDYCRKACQNDFSPCDPQYMKHADGRCSGVLNGVSR